MKSKIEWKLENNKIILSSGTKKFKRGIKVWCYRDFDGLIDGLNKNELPICTANTKRGQKEFDWVGKDFQIFDIAIKIDKYHYQLLDKHNTL